ncbi:VOC family protein [Curtobacterium luteum]|uniref:VOC family protein n=1 Tax=Curtobacterium luteum TaxID=33881 RepID=UPI003819FDD5
MFIFVRDVDDAVASLSGMRGVRTLKPPSDMPWGERVAYVTDPDGNPVALAATN